MDHNFISCNDWKIRHAVISVSQSPVAWAARHLSSSAPIPSLVGLKLHVSPPRTVSRLWKYIRRRLFYSLYGFSLVTYYGMTCNYMRRDMKLANEGEINPVLIDSSWQSFASHTQMPELIHKFPHVSYFLVSFYIFKLRTHQSIPHSDQNSPVTTSTIHYRSSKYYVLWSVPTRFRHNHCETHIDPTL